MKHAISVLILLVLVASAGAQNWTQLGFTAEPGIAFGTPCLGNLMARFWYRGFGVSASAMGFPSGLNLGVTGAGVETDAMYRYSDPRLRGIMPFVAVGYGSSDVMIGATPAFRIGSYVGAQVGAYYNSFFAQLGLGIALTTTGFQVGPSLRSSVFPLLEIGYLYGGTAPTGTGGGTTGTGGSGSGGGNKGSGKK